MKFAKVMFLRVSFCPQGACMAGGMHGRELCRARRCMAGGVCSRKACMTGSVHGRKACMAGGGMHPTGIHSCCCCGLV